ncbi:MAG: lysoplasmalogenase [Clostridiales bacterium]|nr:lysoplasmalogenase [Clostridiales bacterium]
MLYYYTLAAGLIVSVAFIFKRSRGASVQNLFFKAASSLCYLLTSVFAVIANPEHTVFGTFIIMGGVLGLVGDIALDLKCIYLKDANSYLKAGFLFFLVGHLFYNAAVIWQNKFELWWILICLLISVVAACATVFTANIMKVHYGKYRPVVLSYVIFLVLTAVTSILAAFITKSKAMIIMAVGSVLFLLSDVVLNYTYFGRGWNKPIHIFINHFLYYAGQYLIAASIIFVN